MPGHAQKSLAPVFHAHAANLQSGETLLRLGIDRTKTTPRILGQPRPLGRAGRTRRFRPRTAHAAAQQRHTGQKKPVTGNVRANALG